MMMNFRNGEKNKLTKKRIKKNEEEIMVVRTTRQMSMFYDASSAVKPSEKEKLCKLSLSYSICFCVTFFLLLLVL